MISTCLNDTSRKATYKEYLDLLKKGFILGHYFYRAY